MNILADSTLPGLVAAFPEPFEITTYTHADQIPELLGQHDVLLCRSTLKVDSKLLTNHHLTFVATASSGTDHLDRSFLKAQHIDIIDAKGCNAISVADYVVACLASLDPQRLSGIKKAGIIGMGAVGNEVYKRLKSADFEIMTYDPLKAHLESDFTSCELDDLYQCDLLCIHAELHNTPPYPSANLINHAFLTQLKSNCIIINAARGGIVDEAALLSAPSLIYCTDVFLNEPAVDKRIIERATLCTPHIAGHSLEAKFVAVAMISEKLHQLAGLSPPNYEMPVKPSSIDWHKDKCWQEQVLSIYNPAEETLQLKQSMDKETAFLKLRRNHQNRHDFSTYFKSVPFDYKLLLGV